MPMWSDAAVIMNAEIFQRDCTRTDKIIDPVGIRKSGVIEQGSCGP